MNTFIKSASLYDEFYEKKDYVAESEYINALIQRHARGSKSLLDLGCGTGRHAVRLAENGYTVVGIDRSKGMLTQAGAQREKLPPLVRERLSFLEHDIRTIRLGEQFDVVVALFHVISYQTSNEDVLAAFATAKVHLRSHGLFIFDFWYGPGVLGNPPTPRIKRAGDASHLLLRVAEPTVHVHENTVDVRYLFVEAKKAVGSYQEFSETHKMRYFFKPELFFFLEQSGLKPLTLVEWMTDRGLANNTWSAVLVARNDE